MIRKEKGILQLRLACILIIIYLVRPLKSIYSCFHDPMKPHQITETIIVQLGPGPSPSFGPKQNTKLTLDHPPTTHHPPKTFKEVLGKLEA